MKITLNGQIKKLTTPPNLKEVIRQSCRDSNHVIAQVNGAIVKNPLWDQTILNDGDTVELVNFVGGG